MDGVPLKDNAVQSGCFALCAFALALGGVTHLGWGQPEARSRNDCLGLGIPCGHLYDFHFEDRRPYDGRHLLGYLSYMLRVGERSLLIAAPIALVVAIALWSSAPAQRRLAEIATDIHAVDRNKGSSEATVSTASRLDFWSKAVEFIKEAPLFGHGTGSTKSLYQSLEATRPSPYGEAVPDPHNQFFAIAIQVGLVGGAILLVMWAVHFLNVYRRWFRKRDGAGGRYTELHRVAFQ